MKIFGFYITGKLLIAGLLIALGAIVHATARWKIARTNKEDDFTIVDFLILIPICGFSGVIFGLIVSLYFENDTYIWIACGLGAFAGVEGLNKIFEIFLNKLTDKVK